MKKRFIAFVLVIALILGGNFGNAVSAAAATKLTEENMAEAILSIKERIGIGEEYSEFNYYFYESYGKVMWNFNWNSEDGSKYAVANCDEDLHISYVDLYSYNGKLVAPAYTADELESTALELIAQIEPELAGHLVRTGVYSNAYDSSYRYIFTRIENGIPMPDNYVSISVNYVSGALINYGAEWLYGAKLPSAKKLIGEENAASKIAEKVKMVPAYYTGYDEEGNEKLFLAYVPDRTYIAVNAVSGKLYTKRSYWNDDAEFDAGTGNGMSDMASAEEKTAAVLSPKELEKIEELKNLISAEDAVAMLKSYDSLYLDENLNTVTSSLNNDGEGNYYWWIRLSDNRPYDYENGDYYRGYANARINAVTGEIISFNSSVKSLWDFNEEELQTVKANFTKTQCRKIFAAFAKSVNKDRFAQTNLEDIYRTHEIAYDENTSKYTYAGYGFNYDRMHDNIPVIGNSVYGQVDAVSGKIYNYGYYWTEAEIPSSEGMINAEEAFNSYINYDGFDLVYEIVSKYTDNGSYYGNDVTYSVRLVYRTDINPNYVDAFTGKQLSWNGTEYSRNAVEYNYSDIEGTKYEREIKLITSLGAGFEEDTFKPDQVITKSEFARLAYALSSFIGYSDLELTGDDKLTREQAAVALTKAKNLGDIAKLDIFKTGYADEKKISKECLGAVAIMKGYGIMDAKTGNSFKPQAGVTRGEAASLLLKAIRSR